MILLAEHDEPTSLAAKKKRQHGASSWPTSTPKNRVWGFENTASGRPVVEPQLTQENATGSVHYTYQIASGRAEWLSRDPIGENGGINLYGYVGNNPIWAIDPFGLDTLNLVPLVVPSTDIIEMEQSNFDHVIADNDQSHSNEFTVAAHGDAYGIRDQWGNILRAKDLAALIKKDPRYHGQTVRLNACSTAAKDFGQQLADALGGPVEAPNNFLSRTQDPSDFLWGRNTVTNTVVGGGRYVGFFPSSSSL